MGRTKNEEEKKLKFPGKNYFTHKKIKEECLNIEKESIFAIKEDIERREKKRIEQLSANKKLENIRPQDELHPKYMQYMKELKENGKISIKIPYIHEELERSLQYYKAIMTRKERYPEKYQKTIDDENYTPTQYDGFKVMVKIGGEEETDEYDIIVAVAKSENILYKAIYRNMIYVYPHCGNIGNIIIKKNKSCRVLNYLNYEERPYLFFNGHDIETIFNEANQAMKKYNKRKMDQEKYGINKMTNIIKLQKIGEI